MPSLRELCSLEELRLGANAISGELPPDLSDTLRVLSCPSNNLYGSLSSLSNLPHLEALTLTHNGFTNGWDDLAGCAELTHVDLRGNPLSLHDGSRVTPQVSRRVLVSQHPRALVYT